MGDLVLDKHYCCECRWWEPTSIGVIGACEIDMETKLRGTKACPRFEKRRVEKQETTQK